MNEWEIKWISIDEIHPYPNNPRNNQNAVEQTAASIREFGWQQPIVIDENNVIVCGHTRRLAAIELGITEVPCKYAIGLSEEKLKAYRLADNKTSELAEWALDKLQLELSQLDMDMEQFGFEEIDPDKEVEEDDFDEDEYIPEVAKAKYGDVYLLGRHRLMCGDATSSEDIDTLMDGQMCDLVVTDPPYNVDVSNSQGMTIENDNLTDSAFDSLLNKAFDRLHEVMKAGSAFYVWHASSTQMNFESALNRAGLMVRQQLIWAKHHFVLSRQDYQWRHEPCFYGWKDGASHYFIDDRTQSTVIEDELPEFRKMKKPELVALLEEIYADKESTTVLHEKKVAINGDHPTMKPLKLIGRLIKNSSKAWQIVLDTFGGSGSTLMACEQLERTCYTMELDPKYVDVIIARWEKFTGGKAEKL